MGDGSRFREAPGSITERRNTEEGSGIGTRQTGTGTHKQKFTSSKVVPVPPSPVPVPPNIKSPIVKWYRYHTYWYRYQHVILTGFEQNSNSGARVRSSFDHQFKIAKEKGIKAEEKVEKSSF